MAPLSGKFNADFTSFFDACAKADISLKGFDASTKTVEASLNRMVDGFSGRKIISEAVQLAEVFGRVGGTSQLTARELAQVSAVAQEARLKLLALGQEVPPGIQRLAESVRHVDTEAGRAGPQVNTLRTALGSFDGVLSSLGVNIGPGVRGLSELGEASGKSASQLGGIAVAGLAVGAGVAGWQIGRAAAEFFNLDAKIGNATAKLLGWGDVAGQVAGANADSLARASARVGFEVTSLSTALEINNIIVAKWRSNAAISADTVRGWQTALAAVRASGDLGQLSKDLASQNFSLEDLAKRYHLTVEALQFFVRETKTAADAEKVAADKIHDGNERRLKDAQTQIDATKSFKDAMVELDSAGKGWQGTLDTIDGSVAEAIKFYLDAGVSQKALAEAYGLTAAQVKAVASAARDAGEAGREMGAKFAAAAALATEAEKKHNEELTKKKKLALDAAEAAAKLAAIERARGGSTEYDLSTAAGRSKVPPDIQEFLRNGYSFEQASRLAFSLKMGFDVSRDPLFAQKGPRVPGYLEGGPTVAGPALLHADEYVVPKSGALVMRDGPTVSGAPVTNHFYLVDNTENLARKVSTLILRSTLRGGPLG